MQIMEKICVLQFLVQKCIQWTTLSVNLCIFEVHIAVVEINFAFNEAM